MSTSRLLQIYLLVSGLHLVGLYVLPDTAQLVSKTLLMPILVAAVWQAADFSGKKLLLGALLFSWAGDVCIAFSFIAGLVAFLLAHIFYIVLFYRALLSRPKTKPYPWAAWMLLVIFVVALLGLLLPHAGALKIPVTVYALVIGKMLGIALAGRAHWPTQAFRWIAAGAAFFVGSDSLLAWNKFHTAFPLASLSIMLTYLLAQYALTRGILHLETRSGQA